MCGIFSLLNVQNINKLIIQNFQKGIRGKHPDDDAPVTVKEGRYGTYVQHKRTNATLPKGVDQNAVTLEEALVMLAAKASKKKSGAKKKSAAKAGAKKKTVAKKKKNPATAADGANQDSTGSS